MFDSAQFAFEIYSMAMGAHWAFQLLDQKKALKNSRESIMARIRSIATPDMPEAQTGLLTPAVVGVTRVTPCIAALWG
jgi:hypothetical protein